MTQHYTKNTSQVMHFCPTCNRHTMHRVDFKRLGSCTEHCASGLSKAQEKRRKQQEADAEQPKLF